MRVFSNWQSVTSAALLLLGLQAFVLHLFGQPTIAADGTIKLWEGVVQGVGNSQHLSDWYTFSHVIHGLIFYAVLRWLFPQFTLGQRLLIAAVAEMGWELIENTPMVINAYRQQALAQGYTGDSGINSLSDTFAMIAGFLFASRAPVAYSIGIAIFLEAWVGYSIRDNLTLNVLNFLHHFEFIERWQSGA
jgi:hypothetical protein